MASLDCLFIIQGEGRGHMTQALALQRVLARAGHRVRCVLMGRSERREVPPFFLNKIQAPVTAIDSPNYVADAKSRSIRMLPTLWKSLLRAPRILRSLRVIDEAFERHEPDVVINFFEPLAGLYYARYRPEAPMVCIGHQYMFLHPSYRFPPGHRLIRKGLKLFTNLTAWGAAEKLALSLYPAKDHEVEDLRVMPPLLRPELFELPLDEEEPFVLAYLLNRGYAEEIVRWHKANPEVELHCFWDHPEAGAVYAYDDTLTFHRLDDEKFLAMMARCRGFVSTAGFESVSEAMYLGKPVQMVPVEGHFEQFCNALDGVRAGAGIRSDCFDIDRLLAHLPHYDPPNARFRRWVEHADRKVLRAIERAAGLEPQPARREVLAAA